MALTLDTKCVVIFLMLLWTCTSRATCRTLSESEASIATKHEKWMAMHGRVYADSAEKEKRQKIFKENLEFIEKHNKEGNKRYNLSLNSFADLTNQEFVMAHTGALPKPPTQASVGFSKINISVSEIAPSVDWRKKGAVNDIKYQGQCGSCWAFSVVAAVEGLTKIKTGNLISLSEQQLVDCAPSYGYEGCHGYYVDKTFEYIQTSGLATEENYPYKGSVGTCSMFSPAARISGYHDVTPQSEEELLKAVANQPVSVVLDASGQAFQFYNGGVFTGECGTNLNHAVTAVGYDEDSDGKYWLIRNSWGQRWGEGGYMKLKRDTGAPEGVCGVNLQASYPTA